MPVWLGPMGLQPSVVGAIVKLFNETCEDQSK